MLDWLGNRSQKTDHPMYCIEEAERLLTGLSFEPLKALEEITSWLTTLTQAAGFQPAIRLAVIKLVDESGQPIEPELSQLYLTQSALTEFERQQLWQAGWHFWERLALAYRLCLDEMRRGEKLPSARNAEFVLLLVRMLRALANQARLLHLRYMPVSDEFWQSLFEMYQLSEAAGCDNQRVIAYPDDAAPTTARHELLRAMLLEMARPDSMLPRQTDIAARAAARYADACVFEQEPRAGCNWAIDFALAQPPELVAGAGVPQPTIRYFGAGAVTVKLRELVRRLTAEPNAKEQRFGEDYTSAEKLVVLQRLAHYWGERPPQRHEQRAGVEAAIEVALGFAAGWKTIPRVMYGDWTHLISGLDLKLLERLGIVANPDTDKPVVLANWTQHDLSAWGLSAAISRASEAEVKIGMLCTLRTNEGPWRVGVVRRFFRDDQGQPRAGIEVLANKPATVLLRRIGHGGMSVQESDASGNDYMNVLLLSATRAEKKRHELLVARGEFIAGIVYEAMIGAARQHFKFEELLEQGGDFDRVRFTRVSRDSEGATPA